MRKVPGTKIRFVCLRCKFGVNKFQDHTVWTLNLEDQPTSFFSPKRCSWNAQDITLGGPPSPEHNRFHFWILPLLPRVHLKKSKHLTVTEGIAKTEGYPGWKSLCISFFSTSKCSSFRVVAFNGFTSVPALRSCAIDTDLCTTACWCSYTFNPWWCGWRRLGTGRCMF